MTYDAGKGRIDASRVREGLHLERETLRELLRSWSPEDHTNLATILEIDSTESVDAVEDRIKWLFHSKASATAESYVRGAWQKVRDRDQPTTAPAIDTLRSLPTYDELLTEAARKVGAYVKEASMPECETYLAHAIVIGALQKMAPPERATFFTKPIDVSALAASANVNVSAKAPASTLAALATAQASGFGVYAASTTALGFVTHAVGVTLPFAAYAGLTSAIAILIGPVGFLGAAIWGVWNFKNRSDWQTLLAAVIYIATVRNRNIPRLAAESGGDYTGTS